MNEEEMLLRFLTTVNYVYVIFVAFKKLFDISYLFILDNTKVITSHYKKINWTL